VKNRVAQRRKNTVRTAGCRTWKDEEMGDVEAEEEALIAHTISAENCACCRRRQVEEAGEIYRSCREGKRRVDAGAVVVEELTDQEQRVGSAKDDEDAVKGRIWSHDTDHPAVSSAAPGGLSSATATGPGALRLHHWGTDISLQLRACRQRRCRFVEAAHQRMSGCRLLMADDEIVEVSMTRARPAPGEIVEHACDAGIGADQEPWLVGQLVRPARRG